MAEDPQPQTLQQRIAMLNAAHVGRIPGEPPLQRPKPLLPTKRPSIVPRQNSVNIPPANTTVSVVAIHNEPNGIQADHIRPSPPKVKATPPPLPDRRPSETPRPPPRRPSEQLSKRDSLESTSSITSSVSGISFRNSEEFSRSKSRESTAQVKAPAWGETVLPPLPARSQSQQQTEHIPKPKYEVRAPCDTAVKTSHDQSSSAIEPAVTTKAKPALPPRLPPRKSADIPIRGGTSDQISVDPHPKQPTTPRPSALSFALNKESPVPPPVTNRPSSLTPQPPPVPLASRPDLSRIQAMRPTTTGDQPPSQTVCMLCRDFSGPDSHATRFPRQSLPHQSPLQYLAHQLTSPFPSNTDKARAIFTWLHHNILYDVQSFFAGAIRPSTPASTISTGLAVCEGFAGLFTALATLAGLESVVISGHGKGFGFTNLAPGQSIPPFQGNHAWNVVKIDDGEWKLIDSCWGAGHVQGAGMPYAQKFDPNHFTMTNEEFGIRHFPSDRTQFYSRPISWEEYIVINPAYWPGLVETPTIFSDATRDHGLGPRTVLPAVKKISIRQHHGPIRFQWALFCPHATLEQHVKKGLPYVYILAIHGVDGRKDDFIPLEHVRGQDPGGGGDFWYADVVDAQQLGAPGQTITLFAVTSFGQRKGEACRGLTVREFLDGKGRTAMGFQGVVGWELV